MITGKTVALTRWTSVGIVMSLLFNMLSRWVITFLPKREHLFISWLQSPSAVIFESKNIKSIIVCIVSPSICHEVMGLEDFPGRLDGKASVYNAGDLGWIPGLGRFLGEGNSNPLQYSCLEKSHGRRSLVQATVHGVSKSRARLSHFTSLQWDWMP